MTEHHHSSETTGRTGRLPRNQYLVLSALRRACKPRTAYELLDELHDHGFRAPLTVYRALNRLLERGLAHRLESIKAFVACHKHDSDHKEHPVFAMCSACGTALELMESELIALLEHIAERQGFSIDHSIVELHGKCRFCHQKSHMKELA